MEQQLLHTDIAGFAGLGRLVRDIAQGGEIKAHGCHSVTRLGAVHDHEFRIGESGRNTVYRLLEFTAMTYLQKVAGREVVAASRHDGSGDFGKSYTALDAVLVGKMEGLSRSLQRQEKVSQDVDPAALADWLFPLQNIRSFQFIADDYISLDDSDATFRQDLEQLSHLFGDS